MFIGIDTSTQGIAIAIKYNNGKWSFIWESLDEDDIFDKLIHAMGFCVDWADTLLGEDINIYIEEPLYVNNGKTTVKLSMIYAGVVLGILSSGLDVNTVNLTTWKKIIVGNGHARKKEVKDWCRENLGMKDGLRQDFYDATAIALYAERREQLGDTIE